MLRAAIASLDGAHIRSEIEVRELAAPANLAPFSVARAADVRPLHHGTDSDWGTGRFVALYDESEPEEWGGPWRVICFAQGPLETEIGVEQYVADIAWSWLAEALDEHQARHHSLAGTVTKVLSRGYGGLAEQGEGGQLELRASWSPASHDLSAHLEAWAELLALMAGLPPGVEEVGLLDAKRRARG